MPRYWVMAPIESTKPALFNKVWEFDLANNTISIGWSQLGDVSTMSRQELTDAVASTFPEKPPQTKALIVNMLWAFYHEIGPGDAVIARRGRKILAAVGKVTGSATYTPGRNPATSHPGFLPLTWHEQPRDKAFLGIVFPMHTLSEVSEVHYRDFVEGGGPQAPDSELTQEVEDPSAFVLEKYLEDFIVTNFDGIFKGRLRIYSDSEGADGQQFTTEVGSIDILAVEPASGSFVVIELKKGRPSDQVVGQVLRYMGWVKRNLCSNGQGVKGLVICRDPDPKLNYALEMTNGIDVRYYSVAFRLKDAP
jgi:hypothetical protein